MWCLTHMMEPVLKGRKRNCRKFSLIESPNLKFHCIQVRRNKKKHM